MASAKWESGKCRGGSHAKAMLRHSNITKESRAIAAKANPHINTELSHLNKSIYSYQQACDRYDKRIKELDETTNTNKRKDRVTMQCIEIPVPADLDRQHYDKWFAKISNLLGTMYSYENVINAQIHWDEEHSYVDAETKQHRMSRVHGHFSIVPEVDGVLNCKKFSSRANMKKLNNAIDKMTKTEFNCDFMTGTKQKSKKSVDELKNISSQLEALKAHEEIKQLNTDLHTLNAQKAEFEAYRASQTQVLQEREQNINDSVKDIENKAVDYYNRAINLYNSLERESEVFKANKGTLYNQSLTRVERSKIELDNSLLPHMHNKQKDRSMSL